MTTEPDRPAESVDRKLLELLVSPKTRHPLRYDAARRELISDQDKLAFPIRDDIPIMRIDEARATDAPVRPESPTQDKT